MKTTAVSGTKTRAAMRPAEKENGKLCGVFPGERKVLLVTELGADYVRRAGSVYRDLGTSVKHTEGPIT